MGDFLIEELRKTFPYNEEEGTIQEYELRLKNVADLTKYLENWGQK